MHAPHSLSSFWKSREVASLVAHAMKHKDPGWKPTPDAPAWMDLRREIIRSNTKGTYLVPPSLELTRSYCIDQLPFEKDDGAASYLRFRYLLGTFADLLSLLREKISKAFDETAWQRAAVSFHEDAQSRTLFSFFREVSAADRPQAVDCLERVSRRGLRVEWPGALESWICPRDCGVEALVGISTQMLTHLAHTTEQTRRADLPPSPEARKRVIIDSKGPNLIQLRFAGKVAELRGSARKLFVVLFWNEAGVVPFETIWKALFEERSGKPYRQDRKGGPPPRLRTAKCSLERTLRQEFGRPPGRDSWIEGVKGQGYRLNRISVTWQQAKGSQLPFFTIDPTDLDRRSL